MKAFALLVVCGCDQLFGLDTVPPVTADAAIDAGPRTVACDYLWHVIANDSQGAPSASVLAAPVGYAHVSVGGVELPIAGDGTFSFEAAPGPYELLVTTPTDVVHYIRDSDTCHLVTPTFHRLAAAQPTVVTPVNVTTTTQPPATGFVRYLSTGLRAVVAAPFVGGTTYSADWNAAVENDGTSAGLLSAAANDRLYWTHFVPFATYDTLVEAGVAAVTLVNGQTTAVQMTPTAVPQRCATVQTHDLAITKAIADASPRSNGSAAGAWAIVSTPMPSEGPGEGHVVAFGTSLVATDDSLQVTYGNPFPGESDMLQTAASVTWSVANGAATPYPIYGTLNAWVVFTGDPSSACSATVAVPQPIAIVDQFAVAGTALTTDVEALTIDRGHPVPVSLGVTPGAWDALAVYLYEVTAVNGATTLSYVAAYMPLDRDFMIDPSLLLVGHQYLLIAYARAGTPLARTMFDQRAYANPSVQSTMPSLSFTIAN